MFPPLNSTVQPGSVSAAELELQQAALASGQDASANELEEKFLRQARNATSDSSRRLNEAAAKGVRMLSAQGSKA